MPDYEFAQREFEFVMRALNFFTEYVSGAYHCNRCHKMVRTHDSDDPGDQVAMLVGHVAFNCLDDPGAVLLGAGRA